MRRIPNHRLLLPLVLLLTLPLAADPWLQHADPAAAGWSPEALEAARRQAIELGSVAVMAVEDGRVVAAWGAVERPLRLASVRKSLVSLLYGAPVAGGEIDLTATLADLGVDDVGGLSDGEKGARLVDLLAARSGVYHPAAYEPASMKRRRPERGSAAPGERWLYNNWDFNTAGSVLEQRLGGDLFAVFAERLAAPLGMEDFSPTDGYRFLEPSLSLHPAHLFRLSARDLARVGQLVVQQGAWQGRQPVPRRWIADSTRAVTELPAGNPYGASGYGYMWWVYAGDPKAEALFDRLDWIVARGNGGQVLAVAPAARLVLVHRTDLDQGAGVEFRQVGDLFRTLLAAKNTAADPAAAGGAVAAGTAAPRLVALAAAPLGELPPPRPRVEGAPPAAETLAALAGEYRVSPELALVLYAHEGRLYGRPEGPPLAETELVLVGERRLASPIFPVSVEWEEPVDGRVEVLHVELQGQPMTARRVAAAAAAGGSG